MSRQKRFEIGEEVLIHRLRSQGLKGVVVSLNPLRAKVTENDPVFHGAETTDGIHKLVPKTDHLFGRKGRKS